MIPREDPKFTMSMYKSIEDLNAAKAEYYEALAEYLDKKIASALSCHPAVKNDLLREAKYRVHFSKAV